MTEEEFKIKHEELISKYGVCFEDNCDLWSMATGFRYYENEEDEEPIFGITGVHYRRSGDGLEGDFEGYIPLLEENLKEHFKH